MHTTSTTPPASPQGIAQMPEIAVRGHLAEGSLVAVLPGLQVPALPVSLVYACRRELPLRVRVFMAWLEAVMGPEMEDGAGES